MKMTFSKCPTIKCYKYQDYGHVAVNCPSPFKIAINDEVSIETSKPDSIISLKVTHVIKELTVTRHFPSTALLSTLSASSTTDPYCHYLLWSPIPPSLTVDTIPFFSYAYVKY